MLKQRIITAVILVAALLGAVFGLDNTLFAQAIAAVVLVAAWEWSGLAGWGQTPQRAIYTGLVALALVAQSFEPIPFMEYAVLLWWFVAFLLIATYPSTASIWSGRAVILLLVGVLLMVSTWQAVVMLQARGYLGIAAPWSLLFPIVLVVASDTGAYFSGRAFGKRKLAPKVSPGKTWEGLIGGVSLATVISIGVAWYLGLSQNTGTKFIVLCLLVSLVSVVGDLFESIIKRERGMKDSGRILPGHGGMFDRLDSVVAALPVFVAGMQLLGLNQLQLLVLP